MDTQDSSKNTPPPLRLQWRLQQEFKRTFWLSSTKILTLQATFLTSANTKHLYRSFQVCERVYFSFGNCIILMLLICNRCALFRLFSRSDSSGLQSGLPNWGSDPVFQLTLERCNRMHKVQFLNQAVHQFSSRLSLHTIEVFIISQKCPVKRFGNPWLNRPMERKYRMYN